jgi:hypothetical protein
MEAHIQTHHVQLYSFSYMQVDCCNDTCYFDEFVTGLGQELKKQQFASHISMPLDIMYMLFDNSIIT